MDLDAEMTRIKGRLTALETKATTPAGISVVGDLQDGLDALAGVVRGLDELVTSCDARISALETRAQGFPASPPPSSPPTD